MHTISKAFKIPINLVKNLNYRSHTQICAVLNNTTYENKFNCNYNNTNFYTYTSCPPSSSLVSNYRFSTSSNSTQVPELTKKEKLKRAVKEYGSTVIIFHVTISLASLGVCYVIVSSGLDMTNILSYLGLSGSVVTNAGTFVTAYAIHKVFAPVRISITLGATPFIVRYLRRIGFLKVKTPKAK